MYFFKKQGKQHLDLRGNLILSHNTDLIRARSKGNAPRYARNALSIVGIPKLRFGRKVRATWAAVRFIWGKSQAMDAKDLNREEGLK